MWQSIAEQFYDPKSGTEIAAELLYSITRFSRPKRILEIGAGYTTFFLAAAAKALSTSREIGYCPSLSSQNTEPTPYEFYSIDSFSNSSFSYESLRNGLQAAGLISYATLLVGDFKRILLEEPRSLGNLDLVWFDCGGHEEYQFFLENGWSLIKHGGLLIFHYTEIELTVETTAGRSSHMIPSPILNAIRRAQWRLGVDITYEALTLSEPHKKEQGSVTILKKLKPADRIRDVDYDMDFQIIFGDLTSKLNWP